MEVDPKWLADPHDPMRMMSFDVMTQEVRGKHKDTHTRTHARQLRTPCTLSLSLFHAHIHVLTLSLSRTHTLTPTPSPSQLEEAEAQRKAAVQSKKMTDATVVGGRVMLLQRRIEVG